MFDGQRELMPQPGFLHRLGEWAMDRHAYVGWIALGISLGVLLSFPNPWTITFLSIAGVAVLAFATVFCVIAYQAISYLCTNRQLRYERIRRFERASTEAVTWLVELDGQPMARLSDPGWIEMFWTSYQMEPLVEDTQTRERILNDAEWWLVNDLKFRHEQLGSIAELAFVAGGVFSEPGRVVMRALEHGHPEPNLWEMLLLWWGGSRKEKPR